MSYYRIKYTATVYTNEKVADVEQLEEDIEASFDDVLYQIFHGDAYNSMCEVMKKARE